MFRLCAHPNGVHLASAGADGAVRLWHSGHMGGEQALCRSLSTYKAGARVRSCAFVAHGERIVCAVDAPACELHVAALNTTRVQQKTAIIKLDKQEHGM